MTDSVYIDTSCMLKLFVLEAGSVHVRSTAAGLGDILVSSLTELETRTRLLALRRGGSIGHRVYQRLIRELDELLELDPFRVELLSGTVFDTAIAQVKRRGARSCRSLDRLHLAAMQTLGLKSIFTTDARQASAARSLGYRVIG